MGDWFAAKFRKLFTPKPSSANISEKGCLLIVRVVNFCDGENKIIDLPPGELQDGDTFACLNCAGEFPFSSLLPFGEQMVCADCKITVTQKLEQGVPLGKVGAWRKNRHVILPRQDSLELPRRCVCCNAPGMASRTKSLAYLPPIAAIILVICSAGLYLAIGHFLVVAVLFLLALFVLQKRHSVTFSYCEFHQKWKRKWSLVFWAMLSICGLLLLGKSPAFYLSSVLLFFLSLIPLVFSTLQLTIRKIGDETVELSGVGSNFLKIAQQVAPIIARCGKLPVETIANTVNHVWDRQIGRFAMIAKFCLLGVLSYVYRYCRDMPRIVASHFHLLMNVVPILTKANCNTGACHAKAGNGQRGFELSLLGFETQEDYEHIVKEAKGPPRFLLLHPNRAC